MMERAKALQLREQLELVRISALEYRVVTLFDSLTVTSNEATEGVLDRILPALQRGAELPSLLRGLSKRETSAIRAMIRDFDERGLLEPARANGEHSPADERCHARQRRFFSNFEAVTDMGQESDGKAGDAGTLQARLSAATVMVVGLGRVGSRVVDALASAGVGTLIGAGRRAVLPNDVADSDFRRSPSTRYLAYGKPVFGEHGADLPDGVDFLALCEDGFDPDHHAAINHAALQKRIAWIGYRILRTRLEIGPTVIPYETACFHCYELRRISNSAGFAEELELHQRLAESGGDLGTLDITLGADLLALEVVKSLTHFTSAATYGHVYTMDIVSLASHVRPLLKIPRCPECGASAKRPATSVWRYDTQSEPAHV